MVLFTLSPTDIPGKKMNQRIDGGLLEASAAIRWSGCPQGKLLEDSRQKIKYLTFSYFWGLR